MPQTFSDLKTDRMECNASSHPIVFITDGQGGVLCGQAILQSEADPDPNVQDIFKCLRKVIFSNPSPSTEITVLELTGPSEGPQHDSEVMKCIGSLVKLESELLLR